MRREGRSRARVWIKMVRRFAGWRSVVWRPQAWGPSLDLVVKMESVSVVCTRSAPTQSLRSFPADSCRLWNSWWRFDHLTVTDDIISLTSGPGLVSAKTINTKIVFLIFFHSSGAVWESRWTSWAVRPNEPSGFRGRKELLNRASALVTTCP